VETLMSGWWLWIGIGFGWGADFVAVRNGAQLIFKGDKIAARKVTQIRAFLRDDFPLHARFAFKGWYSRGGHFRMKWAGDANWATKQRIRNVLIEVLR
jgi:hypothetical protein